MDDWMHLDSGWSIDPQLARDTVAIGDLSLCQVRLMNDANYPWLVLIPRRHHVNEITDLAEPDRMQLMREVAQVVDALNAETSCDKINIAAIGNVVSQLHVHVVARFRNDASWPKPVWGVGPARAYADAGCAKLISALSLRLLRKGETSSA